MPDKKGEEAGAEERLRMVNRSRVGGTSVLCVLQNRAVESGKKKDKISDSFRKEVKWVALCGANRGIR